MSPASSGRRTRDERGAASIELVILLPALFAVMFLGMQAALYYHARTVAIAAAQEGARAAGAENASAADGRRAASAYLSDAGDALEGSRVQSTRGATDATVVITGRSMSVLPGWHPRVRQSASVTVEEVTAP